LERNLNLRLGRGLWNGRVRNVADLTSAMIFVVRKPIKVCHDLHTQDEYCQNEEYPEEAESNFSLHSETEAS
jgi:hypothetical protein